MPDLFRYEFDETTDMAEVEATFVLAITAVEGLHGEATTRLMVGHALDAAKRACVIDCGTRVGWDLSKLFTQFLTRQFGPDSFRVERVRLDSGDVFQPTTRSANAGEN